MQGVSKLCCIHVASPNSAFSITTLVSASFSDCSNVPRQHSIDRLAAKHSKPSAQAVVKDVRRATRKQYGAEEKIRIVLEGLRGEDSIAELCRREGIAQGVYYKWSKDFMEAGKCRLAGDTSRAANTDEVKDLRREARDLKEVVAEQMLEMRLLKKA